MADDPSIQSAERQRMNGLWQLTSDIMGGIAEVRARGAAYLPKYEIESEPEYRRRLASTPWRPEFVDILQTLTSKPFGRDVTLKGVVPEAVQGRIDPMTKQRTTGFIDDVDGRGSSLTTFAAEAFASAMALGAHAILVDYPPMPENASRADEVAVGARPYWVQVPFDSILALYTDFESGHEVLTHVRFRQSRIERDGFAEKVIEQIRVLEPGLSQIYEKDENGKWVAGEPQPMVRGGKFGSVPIALCFLGKRLGTMEVRPPLQACADLQIELYRALSRQEEILTFAGSPMLSANGMGPPKDGQPITVGPKTILFAPGGGDGVQPKWEFVQPEATNIAEIRKNVEGVQADLRRIGMQPLTEQPGNPTATGKAIDAAKTHSAVKGWALTLNDTLERAFEFTAEYLNEPTTIETQISTDFSVLPYAAEPLKALAEARATKEISHDAYIAGLKRFDALPPDFDADADKALIASEPPVAAQTEVQIRT